MKRNILYLAIRQCVERKVSERMLDIANDILQLPVKKVDLNFHPEFSKEKKLCQCLFYW